ncbi:hypothetical protein C723_2328 [Christiangramia flava JLT2011]|uniref:Uncharacterized protein n=1 Tax=Christiangramia flava JLT2011 TaxID=1229726 RepID=A0A1L7I7J3_9FLAO|nr:hypothetical protein GRFL_2439 [Christiangramia flava JLT2011]OSS38937.1 hypothetical protein C723_2328 [Christiangramia flava JLT2011]
MANEKITEKTTTNTVSFCASVQVGQVTWFFNSLYDSDM